MSKPIAVVISDIHFNIPNLNLSKTALNAAIEDAEDLNIPLIIAGDLNDSKAIIRAEVANELINILSESKTPVYILVGNHDLINERGNSHGLNYLSTLRGVYVIDKTQKTRLNNFNFIPYQNNSEEFLKALHTFPKGSFIVCHQGFKGAAMGDYVLDKTSIDPELVKDYTVISGHYHRHQTIGTVTYIGSPFTMSFGEANDGPKGYLILNEDLSFERRILNLRRHIVIETSVKDARKKTLGINPDDLLWLKVKGPYSELQKLDKNELGQLYIGHSNFKLDLIADNDNNTNQLQSTSSNLSHSEIFDKIIDESSETPEQKSYLKKAWRELTQN